MNANKIRTYAANPLAFLAELIIPSVHGPRQFGDVMAEFQLKRFASIAPALVAVARGEKPPIGRFWWEATKGASKDSDAACCLLWLSAFATRPLDCQVGAADADQADELRKAARDILRLNGWLQSRVEIQNWRIYCSATGANVDILSADVAGSHGARPDVLILNEASHITKEEFASNLLDNSAKVPHGLVVVATNAGFLDTWQFRWRELARTSDRWHFEQWAKPSPWLNLADIEEARQRNTRSRYRRLFWGEWSSGAGDAIEEADIDAAIRLRGPMRGDEKNWHFLAGLDLATRSDHAALIVLGVNSIEHRVAVASVQGWKPVGGRVDLEAIEYAVLKARQQYRMLSVWFDPYQAELMAQRLRRFGLNMQEQTFVGANLNRMATAVLNAFRGRQIDLYREDNLIRDLRKLKLVERSFGYKLEAASDADGHADRAIALAIALPAAMELASHGYTGPIADIVPRAYSSPEPKTMAAGIRVALHSERRRLSQTFLPEGGRLSLRPRGSGFEQIHGMFPRD